MKLAPHLDDILELMGSRRLPDNLAKTLPSAEAHRRRVSQLSELSADTSRNLGTYPVLVIDDVDYVNRQLFPKLVESVSLLLELPNVLVIWICRPPSLSQLENLFNPTAKAPFVRMNPIVVDPLSVREVLVSRLWPLIDVQKSHPDIRALMVEESRATNGRNLRKVLVDDLNRKYGKDRTIKITMKMIPYPFGLRQETFLSEMSNDDIRLVFGMAYHLIAEVQNNTAAYEADYGDWLQIRRTTALQCLGMTDEHYNPVMPDEEQDLWKIINLHEIRGKGGRSGLLLNVLEWCVLDGRTNQEYLDRMKALGFGYPEAMIGMQYCEWARLIEPRVVRTGQYPMRVEERQVDWRVFRHYQVTERGSYYLRYLNRWPEYVWGQQHYHDPDIFRSMIYNTSIYYDLVELLGHYVAADRALHNEAKAMLKTSDPMLPAYLYLPESVVIKDFLASYGAKYCSAHRISRDEIRYEQHLDGAIVAGFLDGLVDNPEAKRLKKLLNRSNGEVAIKREVVEKACQVRAIQVPNPQKLDMERILQTIIDHSWSREAKLSHLKRGIDVETLQKRTLPILKKY